MREPPPAIARRGVLSVRDNVPENSEVGGVARDFALIFRDELAARFILGGEPCGANARRASSDSGCRK